LITPITLGEEQPSDYGGPHAALSKFGKGDGTFTLIHIGYTAVRNKNVRRKQFRLLLNPEQLLEIFPVRIQETSNAFTRLV
jgi:hypothetical protein